MSTTCTLTLTKTVDQGIDLFTTNMSPIEFDNIDPKKLKRKDVKGVKGAFTIENVLSTKECQQLIDFTNGIGYQEAPVSTSIGPVMMKDVRDNTRILYEAPSDMLNVLFERVRKILEKEETHTEDNWRTQGSSWELEGLNERFRFYSYEPGQKFEPHYDGAFAVGNKMSLYTFIVYLNDGFEGGHTTFFPSGPTDKSIKVSPKAGTALLFLHGKSNLSPLHEGSACKKGNKYALRSDVMYRKQKKT